MKAIVVVNMPNECGDCVCASRFYEKYECNLINDDILIDGRNKRYDCPLKPIPKYYPSTSNPQRIEYLKQLGMTEKEQHYYELGHDDCIDEILGETE